MALGKQLPIRLEPDVETRLEAAAVKAGSTKSAIIRLLAKTFVDQVIGRDGAVNLPPRWQDLLPAADARSAKNVRSKKERHEVYRLNCAVNEADAQGVEATPLPTEKVVYPKPKRSKKR